MTFFKTTFMGIDNLIYILLYLTKHEGQHTILVSSPWIILYYFVRNDRILMIYMKHKDYGEKKKLNFR